MRADAIRYAERGFSVFPLAAKSKKPLPGSHGLLDATNDIAGIEALFPESANYNIAIATGPSRIDVIDVDPRNGGDDSFHDLRRRLGDFDAPTVLTPSGGSHFYFRSTTPLVSRSDAFGSEYPGIDVKSKGGYVVAPPSIHPNAGTYRWDLDAPRQIQPLPAAWRERLSSAKSVSNTSALPEKLSPGARRDTLFRLAAMVRRKGVNETEIFALLKAVNNERCSPPLSEAEIAALAVDVARRYPAVDTIFRYRHGAA